MIRETDAGRRASANAFMLVSASFWTDAHTRWIAWPLTVLVAMFIAVGVFIQARINVWNAAFFNALEKKAVPELGPLLWQFALLVVLAGLVMALTVLARMALQVKLRERISRYVVSKWLARRAYYRLYLRTKGSETPEFRIADDVRLAVDPMVDLTIGFVSSLLLAVTFFAVLAQVGGSLAVPALGVTIPAYFVVGALIYAVAMSGTASLLGWPLIRRIGSKNHREGVFRYELTRLRESAPTIAREGTERRESGIVSNAIDELVASWRSVMTAQSRVAGVASSNAVLVGVVPVILAVPKYVSGEMTLGGVMQLATAWVQVQMSLNWIVDNFVRFAEWRASAIRVGEFVRSIDDLEEVDLESTQPAHSGVEPDGPLAPVPVPVPARG